MNTDSTINLRPSTLLEIVDRALRIYRVNFLPFYLMALVTDLPVSVISTALLIQAFSKSGLSLTQPNRVNTVDPAQAQAMLGTLYGALIPALGLALIGMLIQLVLVHGTISYITVEGQLGRRATFGESISAVLQRAGSLIGAVIAYVIILIGIGIALGFTLFLCGLGFGIIFYIVLVLGTFIVPIMVLERTSFSIGLVRSWYLAKARFWRLVGLVVGLGFAMYIVNQIVALLLQALLRTGPGANLVLQAALASIVTSLLLPITPIAYTLYYLDTRIRIEGLDMILRNSTSLRPTLAEVPSPTPERLLAGDDFLNIALLCVGTLIVVLVLGFAVLKLSGGGLL